MGEPSLTEIQRQQADQLSNAYGSGIEDEKETRLHDLERVYAVAHGALVAFLNMLDQETVENWSKSGKSVYQLDDRFILGRVTELIKTLREKAAAAGKSSDGKVEILQMQSQLTEANRKIDMPTRELDQCKAKLQEIEQTNENMRAQATAHQQVHKKVEETVTASPVETSTPAASPKDRGMSEPEWMAIWRNKATFNRDATILTIIGETGVFRKPEIVEMTAQKLTLNPKNSAISDAIIRLDGREAEKGWHFIEKIEGFEKQGTDFGGVLPDMYRITERGRQAYWLLTGLNAMECEYDRLLRRHKSPEHTYLNLVVKEILENKGGYRVLLDAPELSLPGGEKFEPDITAQEIATGEIIFVEVERNTSKDEAYRIQKWRNLCATSNGQVYIFCDTNKYMVGTLIGKVNEALSGLKYASHFSSVEGIQNHELGKDGSIWLKVRLP